MYFFVKTECSRDKVDELTRKVANHEIKTPKGNISFVSPDGCFGFDIIECDSETECRQQYSDLVNQGYCRIIEMTPIEPMGQFIERWKQQHPGAVAA